MLHFTLRPGTMRDYATLAAYHYRAHRPATAMRVLVLQDDHPSVTSRFLRRPALGCVAGVLVESLPALQCRLRDHATGGRYVGWPPGKERAALLNAELRCLSRVVIHPQYRGLGLAVRLVRHALATATTPYVEALAAMGHIHPFFAHAGMTAYHRPPHPHDARLLDALARVGLAPEQLITLDPIATHLSQLPASDGRWLAKELARWYGTLRRVPGGPKGTGEPGKRAPLPDDRSSPWTPVFMPNPSVHDNATRPAATVTERSSSLAPHARLLSDSPLPDGRGSPWSDAGRADHPSKTGDLDTSLLILREAQRRLLCQPVYYLARCDPSVQGEPRP